MAELFISGESKQFDYTGSVQSIELKPGRYKLECYGAQGGTMAVSPWTGIGGKGGYVCGEITIHALTTLYIYCGQQGKGFDGSTYHYGGWNGGGACYGGASGGGGATDISIRNAAWNSTEHLMSRILVAGGGGGSNDYTNGGIGGGVNGSTGANSGGTTLGVGGSQVGGGTGWIKGSFGFGGGSINSYADGGAGGGGWYGGGKGQGSNTAGGGGSGYVYTQETSVRYPSGCLLDENFYLTNTQLSGGVNSGNGYAIVTLIESFDMYEVTVINGVLDAEKTRYAPAEKVYITYQYPDISKLFLYWYSKQVVINDANNKSTYFVMPAEDVTIEAILKNNRLNTNIYKNIFPEVVTDMDYINKLIDNTPTSINDIVQTNHGFELYDVVYKDENGKYKKALAEESTRANVEGIVVKISSDNVFTLMSTGKVEYYHLDYTDTSILYLSDKTPGKLVHYTDISNTIYIPIAIYTGNSIIINIQQGSTGSELAPYIAEEASFETYTTQELNDTISQTIKAIQE